MCGRQFTALADRRKAAAFGLVCKLLDGECIGQLQQMCPSLITQEQGQRCSKVLRSQPESNAKPRAKTVSECIPRLDSYKRCFKAQIEHIFSEVPASVVETGLQKGWRAAMKPGQRFLAPNMCLDTIPMGEHLVEKVVGVEMSDVGRRYKVRWQGYLGQESWEGEENLVGARAAVEEFWIALEEPMPDSEVFRKNKRGRQKIEASITKKKKQKKRGEIVVDEKAAKRHKSELKNDLIFRG